MALWSRLREMTWKSVKTCKQPDDEFLNTLDRQPRTKHKFVDDRRWVWDPLNNSRNRKFINAGERLTHNRPAQSQPPRGRFRKRKFASRDEKITKFDWKHYDIASMRSLRRRKKVPTWMESVELFNDVVWFCLDTHTWIYIPMTAKMVSEFALHDRIRNSGKEFGRVWGVWRWFYALLCLVIGFLGDFVHYLVSNCFEIFEQHLTTPKPC